MRNIVPLNESNTLGTREKRYAAVYAKELFTDRLVIDNDLLPETAGKGNIGSDEKPWDKIYANGLELTGIGEIDLTAYAPLDSPVLTGLPTAPTADSTSNDEQIATTAYVNNLGLKCSGAKVITAETNLTAEDLGSQVIAYPTAASIVCRLPSLSVSRVGTMIKIFNFGTYSVHLYEVTGQALIHTGNSTVSNVTIAPGETLTVFSRGNVWSLVGGSAQLQYGSSFKSLHGQIAYQFLPGGGLEQRGVTGTVPYQSFGVVTMPLAMPSDAYQVIATPIGGSGNGSAGGCTVSIINASQFYVYHWGTVALSAGVCWIAKY